MGFSSSENVAVAIIAQCPRICFFSKIQKRDFLHFFAVTCHKNRKYVHVSKSWLCSKTIRHILDILILLIKIYVALVIVYRTTNLIESGL